MNSNADGAKGTSAPSLMIHLAEFLFYYLCLLSQESGHSYSVLLTVLMFQIYNSTLHSFATMENQVLFFRLTQEF